jgi:hypothetical protein
MGNKQIELSAKSEFQSEQSSRRNTFFDETSSNSEPSEQTTFCTIDYKNMEDIVGQLEETSKNTCSCISDGYFSLEVWLPYEIGGSDKWFVFLTSKNIQEETISGTTPAHENILEESMEIVSTKENQNLVPTVRKRWLTYSKSDDEANYDILGKNILGERNVIQWALDPHSVPKHKLKYKNPEGIITSEIFPTGVILGAIVVDVLNARFILVNDVVADTLYLICYEWSKPKTVGDEYYNILHRMILREYNILWIQTKANGRSNLTASKHNVLNILTTTLQENRTKEIELYPNLQKLFSQYTFQENPDSILLQFKLSLPISVGGSSMWYLSIGTNKNESLHKTTHYLTHPEYVLDSDIFSLKKRCYLKIKKTSQKIFNVIHEGQILRSFAAGQIICAFMLDAFPVCAILYYEDNDILLYYVPWYCEPNADLPFAKMKEILKQHMDAGHNFYWFGSKDMNKLLCNKQSNSTNSSPNEKSNMYTPSNRPYSVSISDLCSVYPLSIHIVSAVDSTFNVEF